MGEALAIILITISSGATLSVFLPVQAYLLPERVSSMQLLIESSTRRTFVIGLVNSIFFGVLIAWLSQLGEFPTLIAVLLLLALLGFAGLGLSAIVNVVQERLYPPSGESTLSLWQKRWRTAVLLIITVLTPVVGWFVLAPILLLIGLGAGLIFQFSRRKEKPDPFVP